jgi:serine/threonine-protein kinase
MKKLAIAAIVVGALAVVTSSAALWRTRDLSKSSNKTPSTTPSTAAGPLVDVPDATNETGSAAAFALTALDLKPKVVRTPSDTIPQGTVISQTPAPGTKAPVGTVVELTVSSGPPQ